MPSFLRDLRRLSRSSFRSEKTDKSAASGSDGSSDNSNSNSNSNSTNKSSSTVDTAAGSSTPPNALLSDSSPNPALPLPRRPSVHPTLSSNRYSINGSQVTLATTISRGQTSTSPFAPRVLSISDNSWVHQKVLLVYGQIADPAQQCIDGTVHVSHHQDSFPATSWPVCDSHFKALVHLQPGPNRIRLDLTSSKVPSGGSTAHSSWININYLPLVSSPPLDLVILLARDSPSTFDAVPERKEREGHGLGIAIRKYKMAAYLWQAFTGEQMNRNSFGRRCFRFEEEWQHGTLSGRDFETGQMRSEAKVHVVRTDKTVSELRALQLGRQDHDSSSLFDIASQAVSDYFQPTSGQTRYVSVLLLDTHWDPSSSTVRGHVAHGGGDGTIQLALYGSHALQSYPSCLEEVVPALTDCTKTDIRFVANDRNESGSNWEAANLGIGAHLQQIGHMLGCNSQESGIMFRDHLTFSRSFLCRESFSTRTKSPGQRLCLPKDECTWHRLDCLRFRFHPCFKLPSDVPLHADNSVQVWSVEGSNLLATAATGVALVEIFTDGSDICKAHIEYIDSTGFGGMQKQVTLSETELRSRLSPDQQKKRMRLVVHSAGQGKYVVEDFGLASSKAAKVKLPSGQFGFRGHKLGSSSTTGSVADEVLFGNYTQRKLLTHVCVYHGRAVEGIEFVYEDTTRQVFGRKDLDIVGSEFNLDTRRGEVITGFFLRVGGFIEGLQILTSLGRKSDMFGDSTGGIGHMMIPPRGYSIAGVSGTCGQCIDGLSLIITR